MNKTEMIKEMILDTKMSMKSFADKAELPYTTLRSILDRGIENASINNIIKICNALSISIDKLYSVDTVTSLSYDQRNILSLYNNLNDCGKKEASKRLEELTELKQYKKISEDRLDEVSSNISVKNQNDDNNYSETNYPDNMSNHIGMAAHNDFSDDEHEQMLMRKDLEEL